MDNDTNGHFFKYFDIKDSVPTICGANDVKNNQWAPLLFSWSYLKFGPWGFRIHMHEIKRMEGLGVLGHEIVGLLTGYIFRECSRRQNGYLLSRCEQLCFIPFLFIFLSLFTLQMWY